MKPTKYQNPLFFLSLVLLNFAGFAQPITCRPNTWHITFPDERPIDFTTYIKDKSAVQEQQKIFNKYFEHKLGGLGRDHEAFTMKALIDDLYTPTMESMYRDPDCSNRRCVAAVKITHGLGQGKHLKVLYEPFYMKLEKIIPKPNGDEMVYKASTHLGVLEYKGGIGRFMPIAKADVDKYKQDYKSDMRSEPRNYGLTPPAPSKPLGPLDVESVIFSFQEIIEFYHAIHKTDRDLYRYCHQLEVHHGGSFYRDNPNDTTRTSKHTLFVTRFDWEGAVKKSEYKAFQLQILMTVTSQDDGANLGHLCPPRCEDVTYPSGQ
jgi:hypothetical protein